MMAESDLLELARSGNPEAIAALMNLVLEPKGVTAKANLKNHCLHIFFLSKQALSQTTISNFVHSGLNALKLNSIQTVKIYAQIAGQDVPTWAEEFAIHRAPSPPMAVPVTPQTLSGHDAPPPMPRLHKVHPIAPPPAPRPRSTSIPPKRTARSTSNPLRLSINRWTRSLAKRFNLSQRSMTALTICGGAFVIGAGVALIGSQLSRTIPPSTTAVVGATSSHQLMSSANQTPGNTPETQAETYLAQMNRAQQEFYQTNQRFAATLEELERSATIIAQSSDYVYRLTLRDQSQSILTATPKSTGVKSYTSAVLLAQTAEGSNIITNIICRTNNPSNFPPIVAQTAQPVQCPTDSSQVFRTGAESG